MGLKARPKNRDDFSPTPEAGGRVPRWADGGPHSVARPFDQVFHYRPDEKGPFLFPLVSLDLSAINASWRGCAHFLYGAVPSVLRLAFGAEQLTIWGDDWEWLRNETLKDGGPYPPSISHRSFELVLEVGGGESFGQFLGEPKFLQPRAAPTLEGDPLVFLGQVYADHLGADCSDFVIYLFWDPESGSAVQITQAS